MASPQQINVSYILLTHKGFNEWEREDICDSDAIISGDEKADLCLGVHMLLMTDTLTFTAYITDISLRMVCPLLRLFLGCEQDHKQNDNDENDNPEHFQ